MITAICCVVRLCLTRFKDKVSYVVHIVDIYFLSRSFTLHANVTILKFKFHLHTNTLHHLLLHIIVEESCRDTVVCKLKSYLLKLEIKP